MCIHMICLLDHNTDCDPNECPSFSGVCHQCSITRLSTISVLILQLQSMELPSVMYKDLVAGACADLSQIRRLLLTQERC